MRGSWSSWRWASPYPVEGIEFRDEAEFLPWSNYEFDGPDIGDPRVHPLYSEWQLLYFGSAQDATSTTVPIEVLLDSGEQLARWADSLRWFFESNVEAGTKLHGAWLPVIKVLLRLQARYWPFVHGRGVLLRDPDTKELVDAVELEYRSHSAEEIAEQLGLTADHAEGLFRYLAWRASGVDPTFRLYDLLRLEDRRTREAQRGVSRYALDFFDAAEMLRRFHHELTGTLLPDIDQDESDAGAADTPRPLSREPRALDAALRRHRLYPHRLHIIAEGETEVRLVIRLFEAFAGRKWEGSGLEITDLGGDKLDGARPMLAGFGIYAQNVALLLDNENDVERVTRNLKESGDVPALSVTLCEPSLEEENFSPRELIDIASRVATSQGAELRLTETELVAAHESRNAGRKHRKGLASVLLQLARSPRHGSATISKPNLADAMADFILEEVTQSEKGHEHVAARRPIVRWVLVTPLRIYRGGSQ